MVFLKPTLRTGIYRSNIKDHQFIQNRVRRGEEALEKFEGNLTGLTVVQLNWKPAADVWSIAECLDHLILADRNYFQDLRAISGGTYRMTFWEKYSPLSGLLGTALRNQMTEDVRKKMSAPSKLKPELSEYEMDILEKYRKNLSELMDLVSQCSEIDLDHCIINSPTLPWITYSLRHALDFLFEHEHRHLNQAIRVMNHDGFPGN